MAMRFAGVVLMSVLAAGCRHSFTREDALAAIERHETIHGLLEPSTAMVAHETVVDCRAIYSTDPSEAEAAGDSAWILLSSAAWLDLADVDAPSDRRQKKHCRAVFTPKADKTVFKDGPDASKTPWTSYWIVETAHTKLELVGIPEDSATGDSAVAHFELTQDRTAIGEILHQPKWSEADGRLFSTTLSGHFRRADGGWRLESFEEAK